MLKILMIVGPTATGKTSLALKLAKKFNGEIVSCDSRQVYQGMDLVTGKDLPVNSQKKKVRLKTIFGQNSFYYSFQNIPVWGLDLVKPDEDFSAGHWAKYSQVIVNYIWQKNKLPIIVGGTGFWLKALLEQVDTLGISPDPVLRKKLNGKNTTELFKLLTKIDPVKAKNLNNSDKNNPRRLIRAIEIAIRKTTATKQAPKSIIKNAKQLKIGLKTDINRLEQSIKNRVIQRIKQGALSEAEKLSNDGYKFDLPSMSACGYRVFKDLQGKGSINGLVQAWCQSERSYAKRQLLWFGRDKSIKWFDVSRQNWSKSVVDWVENWYTNS